MTLVIAVDGPSGSGKSSTSCGVAASLAWAYLDTGAMYRAMTWALQHRDVDIDNPEQIELSCDDVTITVGTDPSEPVIWADGVDVTAAIRRDDVTAAVSAVSAVPRVREHLVGLQRNIIAASDGIVVEGRDIGSVVAPDAQIKIYLVADPHARAARRAAETGAADTVMTGQQLQARDHIDSTRTVSPLEMPADAVLIDSTDLSLDEVVARIVEMAKELR